MMKKTFSVLALAVLVLNQIVVAVDPLVEKVTEPPTAVASGYIY
jgi:hypothetical protein